MVMPSLSLLGTNGDVIQFREWSGPHRALTGARGFGIPPTVLTLLEGAGDGAVFRYSKRGPRDIDLPVGIVGANRGDVEAQQDRLVTALWFDPIVHDEPASLRFTRFDGSVFTIGVHYVAGGETQIGSTGTDTFSQWLLTLRCPDPYWAAADESSFSVRAGNAGRGLLPRLANLRVSSSQVLGSITVHNPGTVSTPLRWVVSGPGGPFTAHTDAESFTFLDTLVDGDVITIDTGTGEVTDQTGANRYAGLDTAPKLFMLQPGATTVGVLLTNATSASRVVGLFRPRRVLVY